MVNRMSLTLGLNLRFLRAGRGVRARGYVRGTRGIKAKHRWSSGANARIIGNLPCGLTDYIFFILLG